MMLFGASRPTDNAGGTGVGPIVNDRQPVDELPVETVPSDGCSQKLVAKFASVAYLFGPVGDADAYKLRLLVDAVHLVVR